MWWFCIPRFVFKLCFHSHPVVLSPGPASSVSKASKFRHDLVALASPGSFDAAWTAVFVKLITRLVCVGICGKNVISTFFTLSRLGCRDQTEPACSETEVAASSHVPLMSDVNLSTLLLRLDIGMTLQVFHLPSPSSRLALTSCLHSRST